MQKINAFLMFDGKAEAAMTFYGSLFPDSEMKRIVRYGPDEAGVEGTVLNAVLSIGRQEVMFFDSFVKHDFTFTPAISLHVNCEIEEEIDRLFVELSRDGRSSCLYRPTSSAQNSAGLLTDTASRDNSIWRRSKTRSDLRTEREERVSSHTDTARDRV